jgi:hypothetical protein
MFLDRVNMKSKNRGRRKKRNAIFLTFQIWLSCKCLINITVNVITIDRWLIGLFFDSAG